MVGGASRIMYFETEGTSQASWYTPVIPIPKRLRQKDPEFKDKLGYMSRPYFNKQTTKGTKTN